MKQNIPMIILNYRFYNSRKLNSIESFFIYKAIPQNELDIC